MKGSVLCVLFQYVCVSRVCAHLLVVFRLCVGLFVCLSEQNTCWKVSQAVKERAHALQDVSFTASKLDEMKKLMQGNKHTTQQTNTNNKLTQNKTQTQTQCSMFYLINPWKVFQSHCKQASCHRRLRKKSVFFVLCFVGLFCLLSLWLFFVCPVVYVYV